MKPILKAIVILHDLNVIGVLVHPIPETSQEIALLRAPGSEQGAQSTNDCTSQACGGAHAGAVKQACSDVHVGGNNGTNPLGHQCFHGPV